MKVLVATPDFPLWDGGISTMAFEVASGFKRLGHEVGVMTPLQSRGGDCLEFDAALPFRVFRIRNIKDHFLKSVYHDFKMGQLMRNHGFDIVLAQSWYPSGIAACKAAKKYGVRFAVTVSGNEILNARLSTPFWRKKMLEVFEKAEHIFCISSFTKKKLMAVTDGLGGIEEKATVVNLGVDYRLFSPSPRDGKMAERLGVGSSKVMLTLSRLVERKGQDMVIRALPEIKKRVPDVKYLICGKGGYEARLREIAHEAGVEADVIFAGYVPDEERQAYYNLADLYIMPSREIADKGDVEGFGITYLEANACEKPVIGGRSGGVGEAIIDNETGLLVDPSDTGDIARACIALLTDSVLSARLGKAGRERIIREFNWDHGCRQMNSVISTGSGALCRPERCP